MSDKATGTAGRPENEQVERTRDGLHRALDAVDHTGWDGDDGRQLLAYVRIALVRPLAIDAGLRGAAASQAEATAWEAVWEAMTKPSLRTAASPWGVLWQVARRSVLGEIVSSRYGTNERRARRLAAAAREGEVQPASSLEHLAEDGWEPAACDVPVVSRVIWAELLEAVAGALVDAGWRSDDARRIVEAVLWMPTTPDARCTIVGWRRLATELDVPPWQARRLALALRGTAEEPGLLPRLAVEGPAVLAEPEVVAAVHATRRRAKEAVTPTATARHAATTSRAQIATG